MLDVVNPWGRPVRPSLGAEVVAQVAREPWQLLGYRELRRAIFAEEQGLFAGSDFDEHDAHALPIVAESQIAGMSDRVVGVVRIYRGEPGTWFGGRLGVRKEYRRFGAIGTALITTAVSTAHALGCGRFLATVQLANVRYFERHHFRVLREIDVLGRPHQLMQAELAAYPPRAEGERLVQGRVA
ncbi:MAG TPA: MSMEG_0567/Sll0786 family nitrogen starvation N-acetyltransferase [Polyangiaceae bacterium]|nr:MSMEG_0567/Sll0786 family nitrogen starvation N-acetyltransferase [Polyangiaceae bacterium]